MDSSSATNKIGDMDQETAAKEVRRRHEAFRSLLPSGPGFSAWLDDKGNDIRMLPSLTECQTAKEALRIISPGLEKAEIDDAISKLFDSAAALTSQARLDNKQIPIRQLFAATVQQTDWIPDEYVKEKTPIFFRIMMRLYEARGLAIMLSRFCQHPIVDSEETATAKAIDQLRNETPREKPDQMFSNLSEAEKEEAMQVLRFKESLTLDEEQLISMCRPMSLEARKEYLTMLESIILDD